VVVIVQGKTNPGQAAGRTSPNGRKRVRISADVPKKRSFLDLVDKDDMLMLSEKRVVDLAV
jgi:hypothetical protein